MRLAAVVALAWMLAGCRSVAPLPSYGTVHDFQLTGENSRTFSSRRLTGQVWVADFIYTTCGGVCPRMTSQMRQLQDAFADGTGIRFVSFTVDPAHDTPAVLAAYARTHNANTGVWSFLTGPAATLQRLDRDDFKLGNVDGSFTHSSRFVLVDRRARIRGYYETSEADSIPRLIADIKLLVNERP